MEADDIGLLLMASAGYDPRVAPKVYEKLGIGYDLLVTPKVYQKLGMIINGDPTGRKRAKLLARSEIMDEAFFIYRFAIAQSPFYVIQTSFVQYKLQWDIQFHCIFYYTNLI